ncbi:NAD(P)/FAD-dependent oxidoreductase [Marinicauda algicola]|uniref:NAD(P)/FAD-dependent oxidoreductase n=1 Tax=Marinicauda algicola TaxID=2029849 RepID=A0A4S2H4S9_9PROT|nr:NAD(P)/FAD-dependent oxidoreductase [Marinicauda algicola]TGY90421.1 NAD(P)/FAD-dependent oxidoreductase [Marinicauda algicola]
MATELPASCDVLVVGAGMSGLAMGHHLKRRGIADFLILEKSGGVGGVWRDNRYPGSGCDVPSHLYSFSFAPKPDWSRKYAPRDEILEYFEDVAGREGLYPHCRFGVAVKALAFDRGEGRWTVALEDGRTLKARAVVSAVGQLSEPFVPEIEGLDGFGGLVMHTARWDRSVDLSGKRVAVIGNAASAIQLLPIVAEEAAQLTVFQRTPNWVIGKPDRRFTALEKWLFRNLPGYRRLYRLGSFLIHESRYTAFRANSLAGRFTRWDLMRQLKRQVPDAALRAKLTPRYAPGCKRILLSNDYFQTLQRETVSLVTDGVARVEADAILTGAGERVPADAIVLATGFRTTEFLSTLDVTGPDGRTLQDTWAGSPSAYRGVAVAGFPNLFMLYGPNTNLGHNSIIFMSERQAEYVANKIGRILKEDIKALSVKPEAQARFDARVQESLAGTVWAGNCPSWYKTSDGRITNNWSGLASAFAFALARPDQADWLAER